jgi:hypothetical protein
MEALKMGEAPAGDTGASRIGGGPGENLMLRPITSYMRLGRHPFIPPNLFVPRDDGVMDVLTAFGLYAAASMLACLPEGLSVAAEATVLIVRHRRIFAPIG